MAELTEEKMAAPRGDTGSDWDGPASNVRTAAPRGSETYRSAPSALQRVHLWRNAHQAGAAGVVLPPAVLVRICRRTQGGAEGPARL